MSSDSNGWVVRRAHQFWASWWHLYRNGDYVRDFVKYEPLRGWRRVRMAFRIWRMFGYGKDFHLRGDGA